MVDHKDVTGVPLQKVVKRIRGPKGTTVVLTIRREGNAKDFEVSIVRAHIEIKNVKAELIPDHKDLGYIKMAGFVPTSCSDIEEAIKSLEAQTQNGKLRGIILDLRNDSGGLLDQSVKLSDMFLSKGIIVTVRNRLAPDQIYKAHPDNTYDGPLIVLVNDGSASASEIFASAIQDNQRGLLIGERTFGKASVQTLFANDRDKLEYYIKLTIARYYSPLGRTIQVIGITPDVTVTEDISGKPTIGFREENLSHHLSALDTGYESPNKEWASRLTQCVNKTKLAEKLYQQDPNPQIKFDFQKMKGADYLECMIQEKEKQG
jgi:C-terminal peptidase prc